MDTRAEQTRMLSADLALAPLVYGRGQAPASAGNFPGPALGPAAQPCQGLSVPSASTDPRVSAGYQGYNTPPVGLLQYSHF